MILTVFRSRLREGHDVDDDPFSVKPAAAMPFTPANSGGPGANPSLGHVQSQPQATRPGPVLGGLRSPGRAWRLAGTRRFIAAVSFCGAMSAFAQTIEAPNVVAIGPNLVTSGQPTAQALAMLSRQGFDAVIYLAPSSVPDAVQDEPELLARQGLQFIHIPIPFGSPTEAHFQAFSAALQRLQGRKVLVHCQVNMRASTLVFLHRVIEQGENPATAWESVTRVWSPVGPWKRLVLSQLGQHGIPFEPY